MGFGRQINVGLNIFTLIALSLSGYLADDYKLVLHFFSSWNYFSL